MQGMYSCLIAIHEFAENFLISLHSLFKFSLLWFQFCRPNVIKPHTVRRVTRQTCISIYCQSSCFIVKVVVVAGAAVSGNCCWNTHIVWHNCCKYTKRTQAHMSGMSGSHISVCGSLTFFRGFRSASFFCCCCCCCIRSLLTTWSRFICCACCLLCCLLPAAAARRLNAIASVVAASLWRICLHSIFIVVRSHFMIWQKRLQLPCARLRLRLRYEEQFALVNCGKLQRPLPMS